VQKSTPQGIKEILSFSAHADSGNMPGAAVMGPAGVAAGAGTVVIVGVNVPLPINQIRPIRHQH
jgi:hypothetical protein